VSDRIALCIEYDGAAFHGWQRQGSPLLPTVQGALEGALTKIADSPVRTFCAGRTDSGVHATAQVVHFDCPVDRGQKAWVMGSNSLLPDTVRVQWARTVGEQFHARFSALSRRYRYIVYQHSVAPALFSRQLTHVREPLNEKSMHEAAQALLGEHDFSAFRAAGCQANSPWRCVNHMSVRRSGHFVVIDIEANAFLQHMVRNIAGALLAVGTGDYPVNWPGELLAGRDRTRSAATASPFGLYLVGVSYPAGMGLPETPLGPCFLS